MRLIFGALSLLVVLAIVGTLGQKQFEALGLAGQRAAAQGAAVPGAMAAPVQGTVPAQSKAIQNNVRDAAAAALQQGADRAAQLANQ